MMVLPIDAVCTVVRDSIMALMTLLPWLSLAVYRDVNVEHRLIKRLLYRV